MRIAESITYIENNYTQSLTIDKIAQKAHLSRRHFTRIFKENYHLSPYEYIMNLRMKHASKLLRNSNLKITFVASQSGFDDPNYFSRIFKSKKGMTPSKYRKKYN
jgi:AraC family L-rhamnose operon transcriptional activator RhaR/AraC family L-rhamnose operon regulatory protein RhaS